MEDRGSAVIVDAACKTSIHDPLVGIQQAKRQHHITTGDNNDLGIGWRSAHRSCGEDGGDIGSCFGVFVAGESCGSIAIPGSMTGGCTEDLGWGSVGGVTTIPGSIVGRFASGAGAVSGGGGGAGVPSGDRLGGGGGGGMISAASAGIETSNNPKTIGMPISTLRIRDHFIVSW